MYVEYCKMNESVGKMHLGWPIIPAQGNFDVLEEKEKQHSLSAWLIHGSLKYVKNAKKRIWFLSLQNVNK